MYTYIIHTSYISLIDTISIFQLIFNKAGGKIHIVLTKEVLSYRKTKSGIFQRPQGLLKKCVSGSKDYRYSVWQI